MVPAQNTTTVNQRDNLLLTEAADSMVRAPVQMTQMKLECKHVWLKKDEDIYQENTELDEERRYV